MTRGASAKLYSTDLLSLATSLAHYPLSEAHKLRAEARSRTCGSTLAAGFILSGEGLVQSVGLRVSACAVGQAAAAIFAAGATGKTANEIRAAQMQVTAWLAGDGLQPDWPGIERLVAALPHSGRHGAIILPWNAAVAALCKAAEPG